MRNRFSSATGGDSPVPFLRRAHRPPTRVLGVLPVVVVLIVLASGTGCSEKTDAEVTPLPSPRPQMGVELPDEVVVELPFVVSGWAVDLSAQGGSGIDVVQVLDGGCEGAVLGIAEYGIERSDIARRNGDQFRFSGWQFEVTRLHLGERILAVRIRSLGATKYNQCLSLPVTVTEKSRG